MQHVVGRSHVEPRVGAGVEPLLGLGRHHSGQPREVAGDKAHRVDGVAVGDGQGVGAEFGVALPGAVGRPRQHALAHQADMNGHDLADIAGLDQFLHVHHDGIDAGLQTDCGDQSVGLGPAPPVPQPPPSSARAAIRNRRACPPLAPPWSARSATARGQRPRPRRSPARRSSGASRQRPAGRPKPGAPPRRCRLGWCTPRSARHPHSPAPPAGGTAPTTSRRRWRRSAPAEPCPPCRSPPKDSCRSVDLTDGAYDLAKTS